MGDPHRQATSSLAAHTMSHHAVVVDEFIVGVLGIEVEGEKSEMFVASMLTGIRPTDRSVHTVAFLMPPDLVAAYTEAMNQASTAGDDTEGWVPLMNPEM